MSDQFDIDKVTDRVIAGVALLDERRPGWEDEVEIETLDMASCFRCVLGQSFGSYDKGINELGVTSGAAYGFDRGPNYRYERSMDEYDLLNRIWTEEIQRRTSR